jgi:hypothetical protein
MQTVSDKFQSIETLSASQHQLYPPLQSVTKPALTTEEAAYYLNRRPQTLRLWAMRQHPIKAINVNGRLAWPVSAIKSLLDGEAV